MQKVPCEHGEDSKLRGGAHSRDAPLLQVKDKEKKKMATNVNLVAAMCKVCVSHPHPNTSSPPSDKVADAFCVLCSWRGSNLP